MTCLVYPLPLYHSNYRYMQNMRQCSHMLLTKKLDIHHGAFKQQYVTHRVFHINKSPNNTLE